MTDLNSLVSLPASVVLLAASITMGRSSSMSCLFPEPETYAMLLAVLGIVGYYMARIRQAAKDNYC